MYYFSSSSQLCVLLRCVLSHKFQWNTWRFEIRMWQIVKKVQGVRKRCKPFLKNNNGDPSFILFYLLCWGGWEAVIRPIWDVFCSQALPLLLCTSPRTSFSDTLSPAHVLSCIACTCSPKRSQSFFSSNSLQQNDRSPPLRGNGGLLLSECVWVDDRLEEGGDHLTHPI